MNAPFIAPHILKSAAEALLDEAMPPRRIPCVVEVAARAIATSDELAWLFALPRPHTAAEAARFAALAGGGA